MSLLKVFYPWKEVYKKKGKCKVCERRRLIAKLYNKSAFWYCKECYNKQIEKELKKWKLKN